jgi:hypothetical protein
MKQSQFFIQLTIISALVALLFFILHQFTRLAQYQDFSWICLSVFVVLSILVFFVGRQKAQHQNPNVFNSLLLSVTFGKMFLAVILVFAYHRTALPQERSFLIPFFIVYLVFTVYEVYFLTKLGNNPSIRREK